eukprot:542840_1
MTTLKAKKKHICELWSISTGHLDNRLKLLKAVIDNKSDSILLDYLLRCDLDIDKCINYHFEQRNTVNKSMLTQDNILTLQPKISKFTISKKDLLKLSKKQLVKRCKKSKVATHGTKQQMADRILIQMKSNKLNNKTLQKMNGLSAFNATLILIEGCVHIYTNIRYYPMDIIIIIAQYICLILIRFDSVHKRYKKVIKNGGTLFHRNTYFKKRKKNQSILKDATRSSFIVGCSIGFNFGIHKWKIKLIKPKPSDWIGIISNIGLFNKSNIDIFTDKGCSVAYMLLGGRYIRSVNADYIAYNQKYKDHNDGYLSIWKKKK